MDTPKAILFDAGGTLVTINPEQFDAVVEPILGARPEPERMFDAHYLAMDTVTRDPSLADRPDWWKRWMASYVGFAGLDGREEVADALVRARGLWTLPIPGVIDAIDAIRKSGIRVAVVSNADGQVADDLEAAGYGQLFETIVDSTEVGVSKPDPAIFSYALEALDVEAADAWYVGDSPLFDLGGAVNAGIANFVLVDPFGLYDHQPSLPSVAELPALLGL